MQQAGEAQAGMSAFAEAGGDGASLLQRADAVAAALGRRIQHHIDQTTPYYRERWAAAATCLVLFGLRVAAYGGFYVIAYGLGIYLLNAFLLFLSPRWDPAMDADENGLANDAPSMTPDVGGAPSARGAEGLLPTGRDDEFRPFVRRLPEFRFWYACMRAVLLALACTAVPLLDIPVFWPILLFYFVALTVATLRRQIAHMIKYNYVPFDLGKKAYPPAAAHSR